jgi:hypothetical protein
MQTKRRHGRIDGFIGEGGRRERERGDFVRVWHLFWSTAQQ